MSRNTWIKPELTPLVIFYIEKKTLKNKLQSAFSLEWFRFKHCSLCIKSLQEHSCRQCPWRAVEQNGSWNILIVAPHAPKHTAGEAVREMLSSSLTLTRKQFPHQSFGTIWTGPRKAPAVCWWTREHAVIFRTAKQWRARVAASEGSAANAAAAGNAWLTKATTLGSH